MDAQFITKSVGNYPPPPAAFNISAIPSGDIGKGLAERLVVLVKLQSLLNDGRIIRHATGFGEAEGLLRGLLRIVEMPKFGTGHAQRVEHGRLSAAGEGVGLGRQGKSGV